MLASNINSKSSRFTIVARFPYSQFRLRNPIIAILLSAPVRSSTVLVLGIIPSMTSFGVQ
jgi:hypothetical protein